MGNITYREHNGSERSVEGPTGENLMEIAIEHDVEGILGECGGNAMCATCHVYVDDEFRHALPQPLDAESAMLDMAPSPRAENSRLGCQITMCDAIDGIRVTVAGDS